MSPVYSTRRKDPALMWLRYATVAFVLIFLLDVALGGRVRSLVRIPVISAWQVRETLFSNVTNSGFFASKHALELENAQLRRALSEFKSRDTAYTAIEDENAYLRKITGFVTGSSGITVPVASSIAASPYGTLIVGGGINQGVARGNMVFTPDGYALGIISESNPDYALATQFFAPTAETEVVVGDIAFTVQGSGGGNAAGKAPRDAVIPEGAVVREKKSGVPIGIVGKVVADAASAYAQVFVRNPNNITSLVFVYVQR